MNENKHPLGLSQRVLDMARQAEADIRGQFAHIDAVAEYNSQKVLAAFQNHRVAEAHFAGTTGYGYDDLGRDTLDQIYAEIFGTEDGDGVALMCGNFDGTFVGSHADIIGMACAIAGKETERSISRMVDRNLNDGLPAFLVAEPGLNNGMMIPQYVAAGLVNEIKLLASPASIDSIPTCAGQEDPVSMSYNAARRA